MLKEHIQKILVKIDLKVKVTNFTNFMNLLILLHRNTFNFVKRPNTYKKLVNNQPFRSIRDTVKHLPISANSLTIRFC